MTENLRLVFSRDGDEENPDYAYVGKVTKDSEGNYTIVDSLDDDNNPIRITADNTQLSGSTDEEKAQRAREFGAIVAYTETSANKTIWGAETGRKHSSSTTTVNQTDTTNTYSMEYARSYYNPTIGSKETTSASIFLTDDDTQIVGTYLNWKTATAGVGTTAKANVPNDSVCPTGWQLPVDDSNGKSYYNLIVSSYSRDTGAINSAEDSARKYKSTGAHIYAPSQALRNTPLSFPLSGRFNFHTGAVYNVASYGAFWSSTSYSAPYARRLDFVSSNLYPQGNGYKGFGFNVRCAAHSKLFH